MANKDVLSGEELLAHQKRRLSRLVATSYREVTEESVDWPLVDGIKVALRHAPSILGNETRVEEHIEQLVEGDGADLLVIQPLELSKEERGMLVNCSGGINEETQGKLRRFLNR